MYGLDPTHERIFSGNRYYFSVTACHESETVGMSTGVGISPTRTLFLAFAHLPLLIIKGIEECIF
jgi:hypothetical protein